MNGIPAQGSEASNIPPGLTNTKKFPRKLILITILIGISIYAIFWAKFFGSPGKSPSPSPTSIIYSYQKEIDQIQTLQASIHSLPKIAPRITDQQHEQNKNTMDSLFLNPAMEALKNNDLGTARNKLLGAKNQITTYGDPLKSVSVPKDIQQKHDPKGKYITKNDSVDPRILEHYLALVDLLVATDKAY